MNSKVMAYLLLHLENNESCTIHAMGKSYFFIAKGNRQFEIEIKLVEENAENLGIY